jgi:hypothetical protein
MGLFDKLFGRKPVEVETKLLSLKILPALVKAET